MNNWFKQRRNLGVVGVALTLVLALLATACAPPAPAGKEETIKIGVHALFTGALASTGVPAASAMIDYTRYINEQGGIDGIELEAPWEDIGRAPVAQGFTAYKRLREKGVIAQLSIVSDNAEMLTTTLQKDEVPMVLMTAYSERMVTKPAGFGGCFAPSPVYVI